MLELTDFLWYTCNNQSLKYYDVRQTTRCGPPPRNQAGPDPREQLHRVQAQLRNTRQHLEEEQANNQNMRQKLAQEVRQNVETALQPAVQSLFHQQIEVVKQEAELLQRENEIDRREHLSHQLEVFLTTGQRELFLTREIVNGDVHTIEPAQIRLARVEGEADAIYKFRHVESDMKVRNKELRVLEANLAMREAAYKTLMREEIEAELRVKLEPEIASRAAEAYQHGFEAGKSEGLTIRQAEKDQGFAEGYRECRRLMDAEQKVRDILSDSAQLDPTTGSKPTSNTYNTGAMSGRENAGKTETKQE
jgi:hypothetical protein